MGNKEVIDWSRVRYSIGADPEVVFSHKKEIVPAVDIFGKNHSNKYTAKGNIGMDTCSSVGELRPRYGYTPMEVVKNLQALIARALRQYPVLAEVDWLAGSAQHNYAIGGHIHFGIPQDLWELMGLTEALNAFLACTYIMFEYKARAHFRKISFYGHLGDTRKKAHGVEYRTISSWLYEPSLALAVLSLAKHITNQAFVNPLYFTKLDLKKLFGASITEIKQRFADHDVRFFQERQADIWQTINSWEVDPACEEGLLLYKGFLKSGYRVGSGDLKHKWGITLKHPTGALTFQQVWEMADEEP